MKRTFAFGLVVALFVLATLPLPPNSVATASAPREAGPEAQMDRAEVRPAEVAKEGEVVVKAIWDFKRENGLWPMALEDLSPKFLDKDVAAAWIYRWSAHGTWSLSGFRGTPLMLIRFGVDESGAGRWSFSDGEWEKPIEGIKETKFPQKKADRGSGEKILHEIDRRIRKQPDQLKHYKGQIVWLIKLRQDAQAANACSMLIAKSPHEWWARFMLASIEKGTVEWGR